MAILKILQVCVYKFQLQYTKFYMSINNRLGYISVLLTLLILVSWAKNPKEINSFNLLLPASYHPSKGHARQIVITSGDCYDWESTQTKIVKVQGTHHGLVPSQTASKNNYCHSNGIVQLVHEGTYPSSVYITAKHRDSGELISIPVRIRDLRRISIFTKSRVMNIKEIQNLQLYGFDAQNNTFTSLEGLRFKWTITEISEEKYSTGAIQKIPLKDSSLYMPLDTRKKLEIQDGVESDLLIIKALRVGKVAVKATCLEPHYEHITDQIILYIHQKFDIQPGTAVHLLVGSQFQYNLYTPLGFRIQLPSPHYDIKVSNPSFIVNNELKVIAPRKDAETTITVRDSRTSPAFTQTVEVFSHQPDALEILIPQYITIGQEIKYDYRFYHNKKLLTGTISPVLLNIAIDEVPLQEGAENVFDLDRVNQKIKGLNKGVGTFIVEYNGLKVTKKIQSMTPLKVVTSRQRIILPVGQIYQLSIVGGSGLYKYSYSPQNNQQSISLSIAFNGLITTRRQGIALIVVTDQKNPNNRLQVKIYVIKMSKIYSLEEYKQFNLNEDGSIYVSASPRFYHESPVAARRIQSQYYTECNDALLRQFTFTPLLNISGPGPLQIININPINYQNLNQLYGGAINNKFLQRVLTDRTAVNKQQLLKQFGLYLKSHDIKKSQLEILFTEMENYGLCAKVLVRPINVYDGEISINKNTHDIALANPSNMKLRVYDRLRNAIPGHKADKENQKEQITITPLGSFNWQTVGGPYKWDAANVGDLQVYINDIKIDSSKSKTRSNYIYPTITCPDTEKSNIYYTLKYKNPVSSSLLRPVQQQQEINVNCKFPETLRIGFSYHPQQGKQVDNYNFVQFSNQNLNETVYIYPGQYFIIYIEPTIHSSSFQSSRNKKPTQFYNASNVHYQFESQKYGKLEEVKQKIDPSNPRTWNTFILKYSSKNVKQADKMKDDSIIITVKEVGNPKIHETVKLPSQIQQTINIKKVNQLKFKNIPAQIDLPNNPQNQYIIQLQNNLDFKRYSVKCDSRLFKCQKFTNHIFITPTNVDKAGIDYVKVIDEYVIGHPQISIPVRITVINGIDLRVSRTNILSKEKGKLVKTNKDELPTDTWVFDGEVFVAVVDIYSYNSSLANEGKSPKQSIKNINPLLVQINFQNIQHDLISQVFRTYDPVNEVVYIVYQLQKVLQDLHYKRAANAPHIEKKLTLKLTAHIKHQNDKPLASNTATVRSYEGISMRGPSGALPIRHLELTNQPREIYEKIESYTYIIQSCSKILEIQGGPPNLKTKLISNPGQGKYFNIIKLNERRYRIQAIQKTSNSDDEKFKRAAVEIKGNEKNLLVLSVYDESESKNRAAQTRQLVEIKCLIMVAPIQNFHISGNSQLLVGREVRYFAEFEQSEHILYSNTLKDECFFKYKWEVKSSDVPSIILKSDKEKMGVNATTNPIFNSPQHQVVITNPETQLRVTIYNQIGKQMGKASKRVTVLNQQKDILVEPINKETLINSDNLLLIPPHSGLTLGRNTVIESISPCDRENSKLSITGDNQLTSGQSERYPKLVKLRERNLGGNRQSSVLPIYANVLITQICTIAVENTDGAILINPSISDSAQVLKFYIMDCLGRRFQNYNFNNIQYRVSVANQKIAIAGIYSRNEGLINIEGHEIGNSQLILQVLSNGIVKARDIVPIVVNVFIQPSRPFSVHIGDLIEFKAPQIKSSDEKWSSVNTRVIKINSKTGQTVASSQGQTQIKLGAMSTTVSVVKLVDIVKDNDKSDDDKENGYKYQLIYSNKLYPFLYDSSSIKQQLHWKCQVLGKQGQFLRGVAQRIRSDGKQYVRCKVQKIPGTNTLQTPIKGLKLRITAENPHIGFYLTKQFEEEIEMFIILSERYINPKDPRYKKEKKPYLLVIQTSQRLDVYQTGGKESWITANEFNGVRQIVSLDLTQYRSGQWRINLVNPRTKQSNHIIISQTLPTSQQLEQGQESKTNVYKQVPKQGLKWTDILVVFMAINFLLILGYQIMQSNNSTHSKTY